MIQLAQLALVFVRAGRNAFNGKRYDAGPVHRHGSNELILLRDFPVTAGRLLRFGHGDHDLDAGRGCLTLPFVEPVDALPGADPEGGEPSRQGDVRVARFNGVSAGIE